MVERQIESTYIGMEMECSWVTVAVRIKILFDRSEFEISGLDFIDIGVRFFALIADSH